MNLYRLDRADGTAVIDPLWRSDYLTRHAAAARENTRAEAADCGQPITVTRISGGGALKPVYTAKPKR